MRRKLGRMFAAAVALAAIAAVVIEIRASARWAEFTARTNLLRAKLEAERGEREPLVGPVRAGNAWDEYGPALVELESRTREWKSLVAEEVGMLTPAMRTHAYTLVRESAPQLQRLRDAARCERAFGASDAPVGALNHAVNLLVLSSRERMFGGDVDGALGELAVALQLSADAGRTPSLLGLMFGLGCLGLVAWELKDVMEDPRVTFAHLERIDALLGALDRHFPSVARSWEWDCIVARETLREIADGTRSVDVSTSRDWPAELTWLAGDRLEPWHVTLLAWRHGFSRRLLVADAAPWLDRTLDALRRGESRKAADAALVYAIHEAEARRSGNALVPLINPGLSDRAWREKRGWFRLVRAASRVRRGLEPDAVDPVTFKPVGVRAEPEGVRVFLPWGKGTGEGRWRGGRGLRDDLVIVIR